MVLEKTLESPLDCKEIQPVHSEGDQQEFTAPFPDKTRSLIEVLQAYTEKCLMIPYHQHISIATQVCGLAVVLDMVNHKE